MLALYRSGRQGEALDVYRRTRTTLSEGFGIEPGRELHELEHAILNHDPALDRGASGRCCFPDQLVLVLPSSDERLEALLALAEPLAKLPGRALLDCAPARGRGVARLHERRAQRLASLTRHRGADSSVHHCRSGRRRGTPRLDLRRQARPSRCARARRGSSRRRRRRSWSEPRRMSVCSSARRSTGNPATASAFPFGGGEHDWAALELGAWLASSSGIALRLLGARADPRQGRRDASRLLADATISRSAGDRDRRRALSSSIPIRPRSSRPLRDATVVGHRASPQAGAERGSAKLGERSFAASRPTLLVHSGPRPSGLAPAGSRTRFTWTIESCDFLEAGRLDRGDEASPTPTRRCAPCSGASPGTAPPLRWFPDRCAANIRFGPTTHCGHCLPVRRDSVRIRLHGLPVGPLHLVDRRARPDPGSRAVLPVPGRDDVGALGICAEIDRQPRNRPNVRPGIGGDDLRQRDLFVAAEALRVERLRPAELDARDGGLGDRRRRWRPSRSLLESTTYAGNSDGPRSEQRDRRDGRTRRRRRDRRANGLPASAARAAPTSSPQVGYRSSGSFASAVAITPIERLR